MEGFSTIDRQNGIAAWKQIADQLSRSIASGAFDETGMVPPETVLAERFGVNRHTVRSAIASLAEGGVLRRVQGRGTIIEKRDRFVFPISRRTRFSDGLSRQAGDMRMRLVASDETEATEEIAAALGIALNTPLVRLRTVGSADGSPVSAAIAHFEKARFADMPELVGRLGSITKALAAQGVPDYVRLSTEITGRTATLEEASLLKLAAGDVVLETVSVNGDPQGLPLQYSRTVFAANRITLRLDTPIA